MSLPAFTNQSFTQFGRRFSCDLLPYLKNFGLLTTGSYEAPVDFQASLTSTFAVSRCLELATFSKNMDPQIFYHLIALLPRKIHHLRIQFRKSFLKILLEPKFRRFSGLNQAFRIPIRDKIRLRFRVSLIKIETANIFVQDDEVTFITYASSNHFAESRAAILSLRSNNFTNKIIYYNLGLSSLDVSSYVIFIHKDATKDRNSREYVKSGELMPTFS